MSARVALLGTGIMGLPMGQNLLRAGHSVACYNRSPQRALPLVAAGATAHDTPAAAAAGADIIISIVTDGPDVEAVLFGPGGAVQGARSGALFIDMSTIAPAAARSLAARCGEQGMRMLDAPVTGGEVGAQKGTLSIMVGGERADLEAATPVLQAVGQTITYCGPHGAGQSVKLCNQICGALNLLGVCEALTLCHKMGVDTEAMVAVIGAGAGASWAMNNLAPKVLRRDFAPGFMIDTQQKDMRLISQAADEAGVPLPGASLAQQLWRAAQAHGMGHEGIHAMVKVLEQMAGVHPEEPA